MEHRDIEENQVVDRYLMGQLPVEEAARFEEHYFHCRQCLEALELCEKLQRGVRRAVAQDALRASVGSAVLAWWLRQGRARLTALAVAALVAVLLPAGLLYRGLRQAAYEPRVMSAVFFFSPERGAVAEDREPTQRIRLSGSPEWIVLSLELDPSAGESYRVTLLSGDEEIWRRNGLEPDPLGSLALSLHSSWLAPGDYVTRVEALGDRGEAAPVARFRFRVLGAE
jgi:hypothetical protein